MLTAAGAKRVVEIGALRGDTTVPLLDLLGPESELHVIDPLPIFDPEEHSRRFPGGTSSTATSATTSCRTFPLSTRRWSTATTTGSPSTTSSRFLHAAAAAAGGRCRCSCCTTSAGPTAGGTSYYEPDRIPDESRQPYARRGLLPGRRDLSDTGGLNPHLANAVEEGGPRNGVMTALEDFVAEHDGSLRVVLLPLYFGLAIVAAEQLLTARPQLREVLDRLESVVGRYELIELGESIRIDEQVQLPQPSPRAIGSPRRRPRATSTWSRRPCWTSTISRTRCASST